MFQATVTSHRGMQSGLSAYMSKAGIEASLVLPVVTPSRFPSTTRNLVSSKLTWLHKILNGNSNLIGFGTLHPDMEMKDIEHVIKRIVDYGWLGLKFHSPQQKFDPTSPKMHRVYSLLAKRNLMVLMDTWFDKKRVKKDHALTPEKLNQIVKFHPQLTVIAPHMAGFNWWGGTRIFRELKNAPNLYFDTSSSAKLSAIDMSMFIALYGVDKIMFGSDHPYRPQAFEMDRIANLGLDDKQLPAVMWENAAKLFKIS